MRGVSEVEVAKPLEMNHATMVKVKHNVLSRIIPLYT